MSVIPNQTNANPTTRFPFPVQGFYNDVALTPQNILPGSSTIGFVVTPPFYEPNKHYLVSYTTNYSQAGSNLVSGRILTGISQNAAPLTLPLANQETKQVIDATTLTANTNYQTIQSVSVPYLTSASSAPAITLFYSGSNLTSTISVQVNESSVIALE
jgi:hypothetical protein